jgi:hypothetical protein
MKPNGGINLGVLTCGPHTSLLIARFPLAAKHRLLTGASQNDLVKERLSIFREDDVAAVAGFAQTDVKCSAVGVVVLDAKSAQLSIPRSSLESGSCKLSELRIGCFDEAFALSKRQITSP